jgi:hypothetical protein
MMDVKRIEKINDPDGNRLALWKNLKFIAGNAELEDSQ